MLLRGWWPVWHVVVWGGGWTLERCTQCVPVSRPGTSTSPPPPPLVYTRHQPSTFLSTSHSLLGYLFQWWLLLWILNIAMIFSAVTPLSCYRHHHNNASAQGYTGTAGYQYQTKGEQYWNHPTEGKINFLYFWVNIPEISQHYYLYLYQLYSLI